VASVALAFFAEFLRACGKHTKAVCKSSPETL